MTSSTALLYAASGLERLMVGNTNNKNLQDSNVAQISAFLYYQANVIAQLESNKAFQNKFKTMVFNQIEKDFGQYIDAQARIKPKSLHHVYEWRKVGSPSGRLFKLQYIDGQSLSFKLDYQFMPSKSYVQTGKGQKRYKFTNKAYVMEKGIPVTIAPRRSKRLVFEIDGMTVFMPKGASVVVKSPGGAASTGRFQLSYARFFNGGLVKSSFARSGFDKLFKNGMDKALSIPSNIKSVKFAFSPSSIRSQADLALAAAFGGGGL